MTSKYVPSFMRDKPLVNTSLPAKEAPQLAPATLAALTSSTASATSSPTVASITSTLSNLQLEKKSIYQPISKVHLTDDDFPTLGSKKPVKPVSVQGTNFAALSREWAKKQEEDAIIAKQAAEKEKIRIQVEQSIRQKEAKEAEEFRMRNIMLPVKRNKIEQEVLDIGGNESDASVADSYDSPEEVEYEEEEEEEEEMNSHWDGHYRDKW
uniref:Uncharacterized protein n=1 Tax=viral metagenome TaxID=1070528 RepID=A0A6C0BHT9_9ZZZZ